MNTTTQPIESPVKYDPPFRSGDFVECRGWRGLLEPGVNPFGASGRERRIVTDDFGIEYWHDPATDIYFASPRFSQESLNREYQRATSHIDTSQFEDFDRAAWQRAGDRHYQVSRLKVDLLSRWVPPGGRILDVGCHVGLFVMLAREAGFESEGIDLSEEAIRVGTERLGVPRLVAGTLENAGFEPASFDAVVVWDVLEHLYNLVEVMEHCATVLRPGGYLFAQVPNHRGISARLKTILCQLGVRGRRYGHFGFPWHLYHFSPASLRHLADRVGLDTVDIRSFSHRSKDGRSDRGITGRLYGWMEHRALSDYLFVVARKPVGDP